MPRKYRIQLRGKDIEFPTYEDAILALTRTGVDGATLVELDEDGNVRGSLNSNELKTIVSEFKDLSSLSVYHQRSKGRLIEDG